MDKNLKKAIELAEKISEYGGRAYFVGGFVRDRLLNINNKDIDIEVHGVKPSELESILDLVGERISIGESFGIYNLKGYSLDIAMPRKEKLIGSGHKDFDIIVDPFIGVKKAAERRDFTVNALMQDVLSLEIIDSFGGVNDLKKGILRHVSDETFIEDPLRVLRGAQFAARFDLKPCEETIKLCRSMELNNLKRERIMMELEKALLKAERPSVFFNFLRDCDQLDFWFPELKALIGVKQNPRFHAEGDVWNHTMMVLDAAVKYRDEAINPFGFMLSALCHDFGKVVATEEINGVIHSYNHEIIGLPLVNDFMHRLTSETKLINYVLNLVKNHMRPNKVAEANSSYKATNKMFDEAIDPKALIYIGLSDSLGRIKDGEDKNKNREFLFERLNYFNELMAKPYVTGKDLIEAGLKPDDKFSEYLSYAHKLRLSGIEKESALKQTLAEANKKRKK